MKSRRDHPRIYVQIPARLSPRSEGETFEVALTRQLGRGGCMIKGARQIPAGSILHATLFVGGRNVSAVSRVLYEVDRGGEILTGLQFLHMAPGDRAALEEFVGKQVRFKVDSVEEDPFS